MLINIPEFYFLIGLAVLGLVLGSFAGAQVWRLRAKQLIDDFASDEEDEIDSVELTRLAPIAAATGVHDRSRCLECGHVLHWYDLVPLISWISTGGRCRYCRGQIGVFEPIMELGLAVVFVVSYQLWPTPLDGWVVIGQFAVWLMACVALAVLFAYDAKWFLLPDVASLWLASLSVVYVALGAIGDDVSASPLPDIIGAVAILSGIYAILHYYSRWRYGPDGVWVGFGDVKLGVGLGILVGTVPLALLAFFLANLIGTLLALPGIATGRIKRSMHIPLGPLLILGTFIAVLWGEQLISAYMSMLI